MLQFLRHFMKRTFRAGHEDHTDRGSMGGKTRRKVQVFVNGKVPLSENDLRIMKKKRTFRAKGIEVVFDGSITQSSDIILNIDIPDFVINGEEDSLSDNSYVCTNPSHTCCLGTSATISPGTIPLSQSLPVPAAISHTPSSTSCSPLSPSLSHIAGLSPRDGDTSPNVSQPEHGGQPTPMDHMCHAGFRTRPFRRPDGPKTVPTGNTRWYYTTAPSRIAAPPEMHGLLERGDLFLHEDTRNDLFQAWIWDGSAWVGAEEGIPHPVFGGKRRLWFRFLKEEGRYDPNWITKKSWKNYKCSQRQEMESGLPASPMFKGINALRN